MEIMGEDIYSAPGEEIYSYGDNYAKSLARIVGQESADVLMVDLEMQDEFVKFPKLMNHTLAFTDINFIWNNTEKAYVAKGEIGLGNIYDKQLNTILDGYVLLERGKNKDEMTIYLQTEFYDVYYFNYKNGVMNAYSTNDEFNLAISGLSDSKRKSNQERGKKPYRFKLATEQAVEKFYKRMQKIH